MTDATATNLHRAGLFVGQLLIAGLIATQNGKLTTPNGTSVGAQAAKDSVTLRSMDDKLTGIDQRSKENSAWIKNFARRHPDPETDTELPNDEEGGEK